MSKKRAFVKYTKQGRLIPGSLIVTTRGGYPIDGLYVEVPTNICCDTDIPGIITSSPKGWVRYTKTGQIVPGSLIVGKSYPKNGIWKEVVIDTCCPVDTATYYRVAGCERMEYHTIRYEGTEELIQGTIVSNDTPECWYIDSIAEGPADVGTISTIWSTNGECSTCTTVTIGTQEWTGRNLDITTYRNGDVIPQVQDPTQWANLTTGAWCYYNNDSVINGPIYGKLYNWYAVNDPRGLAPVGYHVPSNAELTTLKSYLDPNAGGDMKEASTTYWLNPNNGANNSTGFTALGAGYRNASSFSALQAILLCWVTDEVNLSDAYCFYIFHNSGDLNIAATNPKNYGFSVRLIRD